MTALATVNFPEAIQTRLEEGRVARFGPLLMLFARPALALLAQGITFLLFTQLHVPNSSIAIRNWWTVYSTLVDFGCLGLLFWLTLREGIRLRDLIAFAKNKLKQDLLIGLGIFVVVFPICVFGGGMLAMRIAYGSTNPELPEATFIRILPLLAVLYSRILWWPLWSFTEELTYNGYALPRLKAITKSTWLSVALVTFFWSIQHSFLPWVNPQHGLYLFLTFIPLTVVCQLIYLRVRRLPPLIVGHWLMDLVSVVFMLQVG
jgi:uncharacterized protein